MEKNHGFPETIFAVIEKPVGEESYFEARRDLTDFDFDEEVTRKVAVYRLDNVVEATRKIVVIDKLKETII